MLVRESRVDDIIWNAYMPRFREKKDVAWVHV